jgi:Ni,Fe-hydrogenase maturation factor
MVGVGSKAKVTVSLVITAAIDVSDDGYLGTGETVAKHIQKAKDDTRNWTLLKRGALEPEMVSAKFKVNSVVIVPEES